MTQYPEPRPPTPFEPSPAQLKFMPKFEKNDIPRYLFRIHTPVTAGTTTTSYVIAPASKANGPNASKDIFKESPRRLGTSYGITSNGYPSTRGRPT